MISNNDQVRALADELEQAAAGEDIPSAAAAYADCAGRLRTLAKSLASAPPSAHQQPAAVDEAVAIRAFEEHFEASSDDPYFEGELELWLTAWRKALAAQQQGGA